MDIIYTLMTINPATGTSLPLPLFIVSGVVLAACIVGAVIANKAKKKNGGKNKKRK